MVNKGMKRLKRRGLMLVLSSPSGAGKTSLSRRILEVEPELVLSVSWTTRTPRPRENHSEHYHFVNHDEFYDQIIAGGFFEYAQVFNNYYGTPRAPVEEALNAGKDVLFDIDWQGTQQLSMIARMDLVSIFILPPTWAELEKRLRLRAQDPDEIVQYRMSRAHEELSHWAEYDYVLINDDFEETIERVREILHAERLRRFRQLGLSEFI